MWRGNGSRDAHRQPDRPSRRGQCHGWARGSPADVAAAERGAYDGRMMFDDQTASDGRRGVRPAVPTDGLPAVDVVICAYTRKREAFLRRAIASVVAQHEADHVIVVIDHAPELFDAIAGDPALDERVMVVANAYEQGLSGARNTGVDHATAPVVAFLDDDAFAEPGWLDAIRRAHADPATVGTGGWVAPDWEDGARPEWLPEEFWWTVGCSYLGLPGASMSEIRNPIGASMSFARGPLQAVGGFRSGLGRVGTTPLGCEETEAAIRVRALQPGSRIVHLTDTRVGHYVPRTRTTWRYFRDRCLAEGRSKAVVAEAAGSRDGLSSERRYVVRVLPAGVVRGLRDAGRGDIGGLYRSGAIIAGVWLTGLGYLLGRRELEHAGQGRDTAPRRRGALRLTFGLAAATGIGLWLRQRRRGSWSAPTGRGRR